ncbi:hypothetical protein ONZ43_g3107 [Nemania bipapillata]|uniref:Uncharacterized protein n=1 Tax=Nemania bipapillata TaxID=110536 RepID=A0ACC2IY80_9PEZI|nr:hypothetical protein ONZ43_g3107 [Nemania bipapillata]
MTVDIWLPFYIGLGFLITAIALITLLPQPASANTDAKPTTSNMIDEVTEDTPFLSHSAELNDEPTTSHSGKDEGTRSAFSERVKSIYSSLYNNANYAKLLLIVLLFGISSSNIGILILYLSKRYEQTFVQAGYLFSIKGVVNILLLVVIVPFWSTLWPLDTIESQIRLALVGLQVSTIIQCIGLLIIGFAPELWPAILGLVIYALGTGADIFTLSLAKSLATLSTHDDAAGRDYGVIVTFKTIGALIGTPLGTALWVSGLTIGGTLLGLPFFVTTGLLLIALMVAINLHTHVILRTTQLPSAGSPGTAGTAFNTNLSGRPPP